MFLLLPFDSLIVSLLGISLTVLFTLLLVFIIVPAVFGVSFGIRKLYMKTLLKIFAVSMLSTPRPCEEHGEPGPFRLPSATPYLQPRTHPPPRPPRPHSPLCECPSHFF